MLTLPLLVLLLHSLCLFLSLLSLPPFFSAPPGLGNFIFQTKTEISFYGSEVWQSVLVHVHCHDINEATSYSIKLTPLQLNECGDTPDTHLQTRGLPRLADRAQGLAILHKLSCLSAEFGTAIHVEDSIEGDSSAPVIGWVLGEGSGAGSHAGATNPHSLAIKHAIAHAEDDTINSDAAHWNTSGHPLSSTASIRPSHHPQSVFLNSSSSPSCSSPSSRSLLSLPPALTLAQARAHSGGGIGTAAASVLHPPAQSPQASVFVPTE